MPISKTRTCEQCKTAAPFESLKLIPKDKGSYVMVCKECCELLKKRAKPKEGVALKNNVPKKTEAPKMPAEKQAEKDEMVCLRCNYSFKADLSNAGVSYNLMCPYCGREDQLRMKKGVLL